MDEVKKSEPKFIKSVKRGLGSSARRFVRFCLKHSVKPIAGLIVLVAFIVLLTSTAFLGVRLVSATSSRTVQFGLKNIGELATQAGYYTNVQVIEGKRDLFGVTIPFTQSKYVYSYDGSIKVGFDFGAIDIKTDEFAKTITVKIPDPIVISNDIDENSLQIYNESSNIFTPLDLNQVGSSRMKMKEEALRTAADNDIFSMAIENAKLIMTGFISGSFDLQEYKLNFIDPDVR